MGNGLPWMEWGWGGCPVPGPLGRAGEGSPSQMGNSTRPPVLMQADSGLEMEASPHVLLSRMKDNWSRQQKALELASGRDFLPVI